MPRLKDLLEYLATPGLEDIWVLLDVKLILPSLTEVLMGDKTVQAKFDNYADDLFRSIAATLADVKPSSSRPWNQRVLVGCWAVSLVFIPCSTHVFFEMLIFLSIYRQNTSPSAQNIYLNIR